MTSKLPLGLLVLAGCSHELTGPTPSLKTLDPNLVCTQQLTTTVTVHGDGLAPLTEDELTKSPILALPAFTLVRTTDLVGTAATGSFAIPDDPRNTAKSHVHWTNQQTMAIDVDPALALTPGSYDLQVKNPDGLAATAKNALVAVPPPVITSAKPNPVCNAQGPSSITFTGTGFLTVGDTRPTVAIDGMSASVSAVGGCVPIASTLVTAQECTSLTITVPQGTLAVGMHTVTLQNPAPASCAALPAFTLIVEPPPTVSSVVPSVLCSGGGDLVVTGTNFSAMPKVSVGGVTAVTTSSNGTTIHATLGPGLAPGTYSVTVDDQDGCTATLADAITITPGPSVYFVDPPAVWSGISVQATIYVSGLTQAPSGVTLRKTGGGDPIAVSSSFDPQRPNRILAVIPAGLADGDYDVIVATGGCSATLPAGVHVTGTPTIIINDLVPPFAWTSEDTAVTVDGAGFAATPRLYLTPHGATGKVATPLRAVVYVQATRLTAVVSAGLPAGSYDLILVNPDKSVGVLTDKFLVTAADAPPPVVSTLAPQSVINKPGQVVTIGGSGFRSPTVKANCADDAGAKMTIDGALGAVSASSISVSFDMSPLSGGVCVLHVTDGDGTYDDFSALGVTNPAQNLAATQLDQSLATARRALAAAAGRVTRQARYLYAIGGDDGSDAGRIASIEAAPVSLFGALDSFFPLPTGLPEGRSLAGSAVIGRFIYLVGGTTAAGTSDAVLRAELLDPRAAPQVTDLDLVDGNGTGLVAGLWYYRVAAVVNTPSNPGGETLASDPLGVVVPPLPGKVKLTLFWAAVPGATAYRVYRTPAPDQLVGAVQLVGTVSAPTLKLVDNGGAVGAGAPLPEGALGKWHDVGPLPTARAGAGVAVASGGPGVFYLYALGGHSGTAAVDSYTFAKITEADDGSQIVGKFAANAKLLGNARWQLGAGAVVASFKPDETWVYALGGYNSSKSANVSDTTAAQVGADGTLGAPLELSAKMSPALAGYGYASASDFLYAFGGAASGGPTTKALQAKLCTVGQHGCTGPEPPDLVNWNDLGFGLKQARYLPGQSLESAFIFLVGGASDSAAATSTTERTHW
jgi:hypothetical protein